jgi:hypothetical protein
MRAEPSEHEPFQSPTVVEQAVITTLRTGEHVFCTRSELERAIDGPRGTGAPSKTRSTLSTTRASCTSSATSSRRPAQPGDGRARPVDDEYGVRGGSGWPPLVEPGRIR